VQLLATLNRIAIRKQSSKHGNIELHTKLGNTPKELFGKNFEDDMEHKKSAF